ncbi:MAG: hypothetical protein ACXAAI_00695 [Promethearchaeota archaeon]
MDSKELVEILDFLEGRVKGLGFDLKHEKRVLFEILQKKEEQYTEFQDKAKIEWDSFQNKNQKRVIKKTFTTFFYDNFHEFFNTFLHIFFGFKDDSLKLINKEKVSEKILFMEYQYIMTHEEVKDYEKITENLSIKPVFGFSFPINYLYFLIRIFGMIIRKIMQEKIFIVLDGVIVNKAENFNTLNFLITIKDSKDEVFHNYYNMVLYYFLRPFKGIPQDFYDGLLECREKLYQIAMDQYPNAKEKLVDLLYYFYKKCNLLHSLSPLLDFFNFVGARVEDSVFSKIEIIKNEFLGNLEEYSTEKKNAIIRFFNFLDKKSTLYSTFQANNLPSPKSQLNLFLLYMKYYFGSGLEALEVGDILSLPNIFKSTLNNYNRNVDEVIGTRSIRNIKRFSNYLYNLSNIEHLNIVFKKIFNKDISQLNFGFFKTFLKSFNLNFANLIEQENKILSENSNNAPLTFNIIVDHMCRILYVLIDRIFLNTTPDAASINFIDPRSRYIGRNIALRVLELFVFQDINYSDDIWPDFVISLNKDQITEQLKDDFNIEIPPSLFYTDEELTQIMLTYNIQSPTDQPYFEEWLIQEIIIPLHTLIQTIQNSVDDDANEIEVYEKLTEFFIEEDQDQEIIIELKFICREFASFWKNIERTK